MTTTNKSLAQPANNSSSWDVPLNANFGVIDAALGSTTPINVTAVSAVPVTLTSTQYQSLIIKFTGTLSNNVRYDLPSGVGGQWTVYNNTSGSYTVTIGSLGGGTTVAVTQSAKAILASDGTNVFYSDDSRTSPGGSNTYVQFNNSGAFGGSANLTWSGSSLAISGSIVVSGASIYLANTQVLASKNASGTYYQVVQVDGSNNVNIGSTNFTGKISFYNNGAESGYFSTGGALYLGANGTVINTKLSLTHDGSNANISNTTGSMLFYGASTYIWHIGGTEFARLDTNGNFNVGSGNQSGSGLYNCISTLAYFTRTGYSGGFDGGSFNISWGGSTASLWIGSSNIGVISTTSDRRIKENITSLQGGALAQIMALRPVTYTHKTIGIWRPDGEKVGFIADELSACIPQAVVGAPDAVDKHGNILPQNIDPIAILATTIKALQELKMEFDAYKAAHP